MQTMIPPRARAVLTSVVTWLMLGQLLLQGVLDELGDHLPALVEPTTRILALIGGAVLIIRQVTPVYKADRGLV